MAHPMTLAEREEHDYRASLRLDRQCVGQCLASLLTFAATAADVNWDRVVAQLLAGDWPDFLPNIKRLGEAGDGGNPDFEGDLDLASLPGSAVE